MNKSKKFFSLATTISIVLFTACSSTQQANIEKITSVENVRLPDTGQSVQYDTKGKVLAASKSSFYTGQDASIKGSELNYHDNGDGTVTDLNTGLMWQKAHDFTRRNLDETVAYVESMDLAGYNDWRVPTIYFDWHGAGAQRSDPKSGKPVDYELASDMASDYISINNWVRLVRDAK